MNNNCEVCNKEMDRRAIMVCFDCWVALGKPESEEALLVILNNVSSIIKLTKL